MAYGIIGFSGPSGLSQPSGSVWGDCSSQELLDEGTGLFSYQEFFDLPFGAGTAVGSAGGLTIIPGIASAAFTAAITSSVPLNDGNFDSGQVITVGAGAGDGFAIFDRPLGPILAGHKLWMETNVAFGAVASVLQGAFIGFIAGPSNQNVSGTITQEAGGLPPNVGTAVANAKAGVLATAAAARVSNLISTTSLFGFLVTPTGAQATDGLKVDILYMNQPVFSATQTALPATTSTLKTVGTPIYIQLDALNAPSIQANLGTNANGPANVGLIPGDIKAYTTGTGGTLAAYQAAQAYNFGFLKFGIRFDGSSNTVGGAGQGYLYFYVNGVQIARVIVDTTFDTGSDYAPIVSFTGAASGVFYVDWFRAASKLS